MHSRMGASKGASQGLPIEVPGVDVAALQAQHRWRPMPECQQFVGRGRSKHTAVAWQGGIYIFGGDAGHHMLNDMLRFDTLDYSWSSRSAMKGDLPSPRYHHTAVQIKSRMFVFGGYTGDIDSNTNLENRNDLYVCELDKGHWQALRPAGPLPRPRSAHAAVVHEGHMYVFGGFDGQDRLNDLWRIQLNNLDNLQWEEVEQFGDVPPARCNSPAVVAGDAIYIFSGHSGKHTDNRIYRFDISTAVWSVVTALPEAYGGDTAPSRRFGHAMLHHQGRLWVYGGSADNTLPSEVHIFDLQTCLWNRIPGDDRSIAPAGRCFHSAIVVKNAAFVFGGTVDMSMGIRSAEMMSFGLTVMPRSTLAEDLHKLFMSGDLCDTVVSVKGSDTTFSAHWCVLCARCPTLARYQQESATDTRLVVLPEGYSSSVVRAFLQFLYTDRLDTLSSASFDVAKPRGNGPSFEVVLELYNLAVILRVVFLQRVCLDVLRQSVNINNVLELLEAVSLRKLQPLRQYLLHFCCHDANYRRIIATPAFEQLPSQLLAEIVRLREANFGRAGSSFSDPSSLVVGDDSELGGTARTVRLEDDLRCLYSTCLRVEEGTDSEAPCASPNDGDERGRHDSNASAMSNTSMASRFSTSKSRFGAASSDVTLVLEVDSVDDSSIGADETESVCAVRLRCHRAILAARSQFFAGLFRSGMSEAQAGTVVVRIGDASPPIDALMSFIRFLYCDEVFLYQEHSLYVSHAADYYGLSNSRLQAHCAALLLKPLEASATLGLLCSAYDLAIDSAKADLLKLTVARFAELASLPELDFVPQPVLVDIVRHLGRVVSAPRQQSSQFKSRASSLERAPPSRPDSAPVRDGQSHRRAVPENRHSSALDQQSSRSATASARPSLRFKGRSSSFARLGLVLSQRLAGSSSSTGQSSSMVDRDGDYVLASASSGSVSRERSRDSLSPAPPLSAPPLMDDGSFQLEDPHHAHLGLHERLPRPETMAWPDPDRPHSSDSRAHGRRRASSAATIVSGSARKHDSRPTSGQDKTDHDKTEHDVFRHLKAALGRAGLGSHQHSRQRAHTANSHSEQLQPGHPAHDSSDRTSTARHEPAQYGSAPFSASAETSTRSSASSSGAWGYEPTVDTPDELRRSGDAPTLRLPASDSSIQRHGDDARSLQLTAGRSSHQQAGIGRETNVDIESTEDDTSTC